MADEFVDFYEILDLPLDAERSDVRKRISELYIEAQKNLDHRNFNTRVRYQQLFEMTLPQARYILLDAGRRDDYDRLVRAARAPAGNTFVAAPAQEEEAVQTNALSQNSGGGFKLSPTEIRGETPKIDALPEETPDPEKVAREREELWKKWKSGLQSAMEREAAKEKTKPTETVATPLAGRIEAAQNGTRQPEFAADKSTVTPASPPPATSQRPQPKVERPRVKFDFGGEANAQQQDENAPASGAEEFVETDQTTANSQQFQERRDNHHREIMKGELENIGIKGFIIGAGVVLLPGVIFMTVFMSTYYPPNQVSELPIKSAAIAWMLWLAVLGGLAYVSAYFLSKSMRRRQAMQLSMMSYEELLRHTHKDI